MIQPLYIFRKGDKVQVLEDLMAHPEPRPAFVGNVIANHGDYLEVRNIATGTVWAIFAGDAELL